MLLDDTGHEEQSLDNANNVNMSNTSEVSFTYYIITEGEWEGLGMMMLHVIVTWVHSVKLITEGVFKNWPKSGYVICEQQNNSVKHL